MADNIALVPQVPVNMARLNVTYGRQNGDLPDFIEYDLPDDELRTMVAEAIRGGDIPGVGQFPDADLANYEVDRFPATDDIPYNRLFLRPKTEFGA